MSSSSDRWPTTPKARAVMDRARGGMVRQAENLSRSTSPRDRAARDRILRTAREPWPHADDIVAAAERLLSMVPADDAGELTLVLGQGALESASAHGAQDRSQRALAHLPCPSYLDIYFECDEVAVKVGSQVVAVEHVPAREHGLDAQGVAVYRALRRDGALPAAAAKVAALVTTDHRPGPAAFAERSADPVWQTDPDR